MITAQQVINVAKKYMGAQQYGTVHKSIIDRYNKVTPRPSGYKMTYDDAWCDAFVTAVADEVGVSELIGRECGVERHIKVFQKLGIWLGRVQPRVGDLITFDWDGGGFADHIGFVAEVSGDMLRTVEGNSNARVEEKYFGCKDWRIKGFARPKYGQLVASMEENLSVVASEVIAGQWGNNPERAKQLIAAGYDAGGVQNRVNELLIGKFESVSPDVKQVKVAHHATNYYTGQRIASWVIGTQFDVLERNSVSGGEIYLLGYKGDVIGWMRDKDVTVI